MSETKKTVTEILNWIITRYGIKISLLSNPLT